MPGIIPILHSSGVIIPGQFGPINLDLDFKGVSAYNINVLPKDKYGRILIPIDSESITVVDEEQELTLIFN